MTLDKCINLEELHLSYVTTTSPAVIYAIVKSCPKIKILQLESCILVNNDCMLQISVSLKFLEQLNLRDCHLVSDSGISYLTNGKCNRTLKYLNISGLHQVTTSTLSRLAAYCNELRLLHVFGCGFSQKQIVEFKAQLRSCDIIMTSRGKIEIISLEDLRLPG